MIVRLFFILAILLYKSICIAQNLPDSMQLKKMDSIIQKVATYNESYFALYSIDTHYIVLKSERGEYILYYINSNLAIEKEEIVQLSKEYESAIFQNYSRAYSEDTLIHPHSNFVFFSLYKQKDRIFNCKVALLHLKKHKNYDCINPKIHDFFMRKYMIYKYK